MSIRHSQGQHIAVEDLFEGLDMTTRLTLAEKAPLNRRTTVGQNYYATSIWAGDDVTSKLE